MTSSPPNHCPQCGSPVVENAHYCHQCGGALQPAAAAKLRPRGESAGNGPGESPPPRRAGTGLTGEKPLWEGRFSGKGMIHSWLLAGIVTLVVLVLAVLTLLSGMLLWIALGAVALGWLWLGLLLAYRKLSWRFILTDQRFIHHRGILHRVIDRIEVIDIDDVSYEQTIVERMVGVGRVVITSSDRSHPEFRMQGIDDVERVATLIDDARRSERMRRGLYVESV